VLGALGVLAPQLPAQAQVSARAELELGFDSARVRDQPVARQGLDRGDRGGGMTEEMTVSTVLSSKSVWNHWFDASNRARVGRPRPNVEATNGSVISAPVGVTRDARELAARGRQSDITRHVVRVLEIQGRSAEGPASRAR
jgi:hypothetical protein